MKDKAVVLSMSQMSRSVGVGHLVPGGWVQKVK